MEFSDISIPDIYKSSQDFRFFLKWFDECLQKCKYDHEHFFDLYDPLRCPDDLLWCLADTMGFKYDDRLPVAFNRLVLIYFMSMIRLKGSKDGVTLAASVNLAQYRIIEEGITGYYENDEDKNPVWVDPIEILQRRLENTQIPVNAVYVTKHTERGFIEVVYFSNQRPIDACIEYVRPLGMYIFQESGVRFDARTKISVDARLMNTNNIYESIGSTHVGHYSREDYARLQKTQPWSSDFGWEPDRDHKRRKAWYRNSEYEGEQGAQLRTGYRSLYSLQLANNDHIVNSLIKDPGTGKTNPPDFIFSIGYNPIEVTSHVKWPASTAEDVPGYSHKNMSENPMYPDTPLYNLRYDAGKDEELTPETYVNAKERTQKITKPDPRVNPVMTAIGDKITPTPDNTMYSAPDDYFNQKVTDENGE